MGAPPACTSDFRELAKRRLPKIVFDYVDGGSFSETTLRANVDDFRKLRLRQKVMVDVAGRSAATSVLGSAASMPLIIAPTGLTGILAPGNMGEIITARAAEAAGIPFTLGVLSTASMEEVRAATQGPFWIQTKPYRDRTFLKAFIERAIAVDCPVLVVTIDGQVLGQHYRGVRNRFGNPRAVRLDNFMQYAARPAWSLESVIKGTRLRLGNLEGMPGVPDGLWSAMGWVAQQVDPATDWNDLDWIRENWPGKLLIKGILDPQDAEEAIAIGADAISVSNHGGNQLDGAPSTIAALPAVVEQVAGRIDVLLDGGIRTGQDVAKALALGASACLAGRAPLYGLGARGDAGVAAILECIRLELNVTMALVGARNVSELTQDILWKP